MAVVANKEQQVVFNELIFEIVIWILTYELIQIQIADALLCILIVFSFDHLKTVIPFKTFIFH